jgi:hypothetical protein
MQELRLEALILWLLAKSRGIFMSYRMLLVTGARFRRACGVE